MQYFRTMPAYRELIDLLDSKIRLSFPAELHGYICGIICGMKQEQKYLSSIYERFQEDAELTEEYKKILAKLMVISFKELQGANCDFQLMVPEDRESLASRCEALAKWCQNFLAGLGISEVSASTFKRSDLHEALQDISKIAAMNYREIAGSQEEEAAYFEVQEHVKIGVLLIYIEQANEAKIKRGKENLH